MSTPKKKKTKGKAVKQGTRKQITRKSLLTYLPWVGLIMGTAFLFLWPVILAEYTELDDKHLILTNTEMFMRRPDKVWVMSLFTPHYKPLVLLSWVIEGNLFGLKSSVLHFNNLLLHAINSVLAFFIVLRLSSCFSSTRTRAQLIALFSALLFAVHPLHVESVAWAIERKDVMYTCFFFLGILAYFRYLDKPSLKWMLLTTVSFAASLLCKAPAIIFPAVLFLIDWAYGRPLKLARFTEKWPVHIMFVIGLALFGVFGVLGNVESGGKGKGKGKAVAAPVATEGSLERMISEKPVSDVYPLTELPGFYSKIALIGLKGIFWYLHSYIPVGLSLAYPYRDWLPAIGHGIHILPALLALGAFFVWRRRKDKPFLFFTHVFFFLTLAPALIRTGLGKGIFLSDRYVYIPILGLLFFICGILVSWMDKKSWPVKRQYIVMGTLVLLFGSIAFLQARVWRTGETLWTNVINKFPNIDYAYVNRAIWYKDNNMQQKAIDDLSVAIELDRFDDHALIHRGTILRQAGNKEQALADFNQVLSHAPGNEHAINGKANVLFELGRYAEAEEIYSQGLKIKPKMVTLLVNRAASRYFLRKYDEALADLAKAESIAPYYGSLYQKRTVIYMALGDYPNAVIAARKTAQFEPQNHANFGDLGVALQNLGRHQEAIEAFTQAIGVFNRGERYYRARARSYEAVGNMNAAQQDLQKADSL